MAPETAVGCDQLSSLLVGEFSDYDFSLYSPRGKTDARAGAFTVQAGSAFSRHTYGPTASPLAKYWQTIYTHDGGTVLNDSLYRRLSGWGRSTACFFMFTVGSGLYAPITVPLPSNTNIPVVERKVVVQQPYHVEALDWIKERTNYGWDRVAALLGVSRQTVNSWRNDKPIEDENRRRILAVRNVLERANERYQTRDELVTWLDNPRGLDGRTPAQLLETGEIDRARLLAVARRSANVQVPRAWARRPAAERFRGTVEQREEAVPPETES